MKDDELFSPATIGERAELLSETVHEFTTHPRSESQEREGLDHLVDECLEMARAAEAQSNSIRKNQGMNRLKLIVMFLNN